MNRWVNDEQNLDDFVRFFELSLDLFCIVNGDGSFVRINANFLRVLGHTQADLLGRPFLRFVHPDDRLRTSSELQRLQEGGEVVRFRNRFQDAANRYHLFEWSAKVEGRLSYAAARNISDRIRAEAAEQELELAHVFQRALYPQRAPQISGLEIVGEVFPVAQVCGDYYDFIRLGEKQIGISLGDAAGHEYKSALQMVQLRAGLRILLRKTSELRRIAEELNEILCDDFTVVPSFVSFFLASIDLETRTLRYIGAGHDAFIFKADGSTTHLDSTGLVLGVRVGEKYPTEGGPLAWETGDTLVVFTDGFNEAINQTGEEFGKTRVLEALAGQRHESARAMIDHLYQSVTAFVGVTPVQDDMTVVVVRATV